MVITDICARAHDTAHGNVILTAFRRFYCVFHIGGNALVKTVLFYLRHCIWAVGAAAHNVALQICVIVKVAVGFCLHTNRVVCCRRQQRRNGQNGGGRDGKC